MEDVGALRAGALYAGRYRIAMQIGKGGMGRVYLAEDERLGGKPVALKLTRPRPEERDAFLTEAKLMSALTHAHLPGIVDYYPPDANGLACIIMDYIAGDTLAERFERFGLRLPFRLLLRYLLQLCDVLAYLHAQSPPIVFRDLKPSNVLIDQADRAVLVDFGIARRYRAGEQADTIMLGTPGFAAPEQLRGEQSDARTDLYAIGALAYFLLSGGRFAMRHRGDMRVALQGDATPGFAALLERLLADDPDRRPQSAAELSRLLRELAPDEPDNPEPGPAERESGVTVVAIASAYAGAGATFATLAASAALSRAGIAHAVVECPAAAGAEGELVALLDGERDMPRGAAFADPAGMRPATPAWRRGAAAYYPADPDEPGRPEPLGEAFAGWLRRLGAPIVLLDASSRWADADMRRWLARSADRIWLVADCFPAKWTKRRQEACVALRQSRERERAPAPDWIANRDQRFRGRQQWLRLFPRTPAALLPQLPAERMADASWRGTGMPDDAATVKQLDAALGPLLAELVSVKPHPRRR